MPDGDFRVGEALGDRSLGLVGGDAIELWVSWSVRFPGRWPLLGVLGTGWLDVGGGEFNCACFDCKRWTLVADDTEEQGLIFELELQVDVRGLCPTFGMAEREDLLEGERQNSLTLLGMGGQTDLPGILVLNFEACTAVVDVAPLPCYSYLSQTRVPVKLSALQIHSASRWAS